MRPTPRLWPSDPMSQSWGHITIRHQIAHHVTDSTAESSAESTESEHAELLFVLDRSESMQSMAPEAIGGFNHFVEEQRKLAGKATLTLVLFDHVYEVVHAGLTLENVPALSTNTYVPRGTTALYDAIGRTLDEAVARHATLDAEQRPGNVVISILTDGHENASSDYSGARVRELIEARRAEGWEFVFLAANQDAISTADILSIPLADTESFAATKAGTSAAFLRVSEKVAFKRRVR